MEKRPYHHGDLRAALVEAGLGLLGERTVDELSLREVARTVGVSATAVYRHFPDKQALLAALAREGLDRLAAAQHAAAEGAEGKDGFAETGRTYVRFALANPALFRLMFTSAPPCDGEGEAMRFLRANTAAELPEDTDRRTVEIQAFRAWSLVHGLAMLMLDHQIPADESLIPLVIGPPDR